MRAYSESIERVKNNLNTPDSGLSSHEAASRLVQYGPNQFAQAKKESLLYRFVKQLADPMIILLIGAATISGIIGEIADALIICFVVLLNAIMGVVQEAKAEKALESLQSMSESIAKVKRDGKVVLIKTQELVPGDIVELEAGDAVPADLRLIGGASLKIEEASLTGESVPVEKDFGTLEAKEKDIPLADRINMAYLGTNVVYGRGEGIVIETGMKTEMGKIAGIIANTKEDSTPLQKKLGKLSKTLSYLVIGIAVFMFAFSLIKDGDYSQTKILSLFMISVSLAVAAVPEGLATVVTLVLSMGVTKMAKHNAIIRKLTAVETLGCTQVICSDKTGTLTQNRMTVIETYGPEKELATALALASDASRNGDQAVGDPTEVALIDFAASIDLPKEELEKHLPRVNELPFDSQRKLMTTLHLKDDGTFIQYTKGAPDELLRKCSYYLAEDGVKPLDDKAKKEILEKNKYFADQALRVLSAAYKDYAEKPLDFSMELNENHLIFIGLVGMIDPIRPEAKAAIEECQKAGIKVIMITGDHKDTAKAIAKQLGLITSDAQAITGLGLEEMSDERFAEKVTDYAVYARVKPEDKVRIVKAWQAKGKIVAMTGDGVNDAPALKVADIGVGMGITGTDVTKKVADMVLADDNFATIVNAVGEGRRIYSNILKAIQFLLSSNLAEVVALFIATIIDVRLLLPVQLLWINLITDTLPALALGMEVAEDNVMSKAPRDPKESIFANKVGVNIFYQGTAIALLTLASYWVGSQYSLGDTSTMAFVTLSMCEIFHSLNLHSLDQSIFHITKLNMYLIGSMILSFILTLSVVYTPLNTFFHLVALSLPEFLIAMALALAIIPITEIGKLITRKRNK